MLKQVYDEATWRALASAHARRVEAWTTPHLERRRRGIKDAVMDFMFEYYPYSPNRLRTWHPGSGVIVVGDWHPSSQASAYVQNDDGWTVDTDQVDRPRLSLTLRILEGTRSRPAQHSCFGLHEWAMVYELEPEQIRHQEQPMRVSGAQIKAAVDEVGLRCTHIDAFRFFTTAAAPMNATTPTRMTQPDVEQPGCLHANMDLYKYAMWFQPFVGSDLVADCFELACTARELDMRASPYDVSEHGLAPIPVESTEGRAEYVKHQRALLSAAEPLRDRLIQSLTHLSARVTTPVP